MQANLKTLIEGALTLIPGLYPVSRKPVPETGTHSARYCYSVWLRHLVTAHENGLQTDPRVVAELGPGSSLGTGLAALISGAESYCALEVVEYGGTERNLAIFDQLVDLFRSREPIPGEDEFPEVNPNLDSYQFPDQVLTAERFNRVLETNRIARLRKSVASAGADDSCIYYKVPWHDLEVIESSSIDMIFSQAVLEHVDDLGHCYDGMYQWLKPGGLMSHTVDFRCHNTARDWNGHWTYSDLTWWLVRGRRSHPSINRLPLSQHLRFMQLAGFNVVVEQRLPLPTKINEKQVAPRFRPISQTDLTTSGVLIQALK